jgi:hypothetical protein
VTNCRCKRVSPSEKTKREQSISKEKTKKREREKAAKKKGGGYALILGPLAYLCGTRALLQRLTAMAIRRSKRRTSALRSAREREREGRKRDSEEVRGGGDGGPRPAFTWSGPNLPCGQAQLCSSGRGQEPYLVAKPSYVHIEVAKPSLLVIHIKLAKPTLCYLQREQLLAPNLPMKEGNLFCRYEIHRTGML